MSQRKPIIGIAGGIGSGKTLVARQLESLGGVVVDADRIAKQMLDDPSVQQRIVEWWGEQMLDGQGRVDHGRLAEVVFADGQKRHRLEALIHPLVAAKRDRIIADAQHDPMAKAIVLDVPLLFEVEWDKLCDVILFVEADRPLRVEREHRHRGWSESELAKRENAQWALDKKRRLAHHIIQNNASEAECLAQVRDVLTRILDQSCV